MKQAIIVFSGGPDSTAAALWAMANGYSPHLLTFQFKSQEQYGEIFAAMQVAQILQFPHTIIDFKSVMASFAPNVHILMHAGVPAKTDDKSREHLLPFGAGLILSAASSFTLYNGVDTVIWGATKSDRLGGNFEYGQAFADDFANLVTKAYGTTFKVIVPFDQMHKFEVMKLFIGKEDLFAKTWSCKGGGTVQSGNTKACIARRIAAKAAGIADLTAYANTKFISPLSDDQIRNIGTLSDDDLVHIFESEKPPKP